jgi:hypothetical protein
VREALDHGDTFERVSPDNRFADAVKFDGGCGMHTIRPRDAVFENNLDYARGCHWQ